MRNTPIRKRFIFIGSRVLIFVYFRFLDGTEFQYRTLEPDLEFPSPGTREYKSAYRYGHCKSIYYQSIFNSELNGMAKVGITKD